MLCERGERMNGHYKQRNFQSILFAFSAIVFVMVANAVAPPHLTRVGKFSYTGAPEDLGKAPYSGTVNVNDTFVAMAEKVYARTFSVNDTSVDTPSIFFVIDNSGSMSGNGNNNPTDRWGNRYVVTAMFIDSLYKYYPTTEIGFAVFGEFLWFRPSYSPLLAQCIAPNNKYDTSNGAYVPLYRLNKTYGTQLGYQIVKQFLATDTAGTGNGRYVTLSYTPPDPYGSTYTNINAGFEAAKSAFTKSTRSKKEDHFIIFLSDGESNRPTNDPTYYTTVAGATGVPTTLTVYFTNNGAVPGQIATMTQNVQNNNYSLANPKTRAWAYNNTSQEALTSFLMDSVLTIISPAANAKPTTITVNSSSVTGWDSAGSAFSFGKLFPLLGPTTPFAMSVVYRLPAGSSPPTETHTVNFNVNRQAGVNVPAPPFEKKYWDRDLTFRFGGAQIAVGTSATNPIELRFDFNPGTANYPYSNVTVDLYNAVGPTLDHETVTLLKGAGSFFSGTFTLATATTMTPGNHILEHAVAGDSVIAIFKNGENPKLPLDTFLVVLPLNIAPISIIDSAVTRDLNGNGYIDRIDFFVSRDTVYSPTAKNFTVTYNGITLVVDSVATSGRVMTLYIKEQKNSIPQTGWTPKVTVSDLPGVANGSVTALDRCPPVIWRVVKNELTKDHRLDTVWVSMSEKIAPTNGNSFGAMQPSRIFNVWNIDGSVKIDTILPGIPTLLTVINDSIVVFVMSNGRNLTDSNRLNLVDVDPLLCDKNGNVPNSINQKVLVEIKRPLVTAQAVPNPSGPTARRVEPGSLYFVNTPDALTWIKLDRAGSAIVVQNLPIPSNREDLNKLSGVLHIYDVAGNVVATAESDQNFGTSLNPSNKNFADLNLYWNGFNMQKMRVAPGIYRAVIYIDYHGLKGFKNTRTTTKIGIGK
jgi:hypothetical protein